MSATITSIAHYLPPEIYTNEYFEKYLETTHDWIMARTGIAERRFAKSGGTSDLIVPAALECIEKRGIDKNEIDCILVATVTPDHFFPSTAALVQHKLDIKNCWGFDISAACSGFVFAISTAKSLVESGMAKKVLLCGADKMSSIVNFNDRAQAVLFGDGAGVCIIEKSNDENLGILDQILRIDGLGGQYLHQKAGGSAKPSSAATVAAEEHYIYQDGQAVFKHAVKGMADVSVDIMKKNNLTSDDISWLVPHQANLRIIAATANRMELDPEKVMINIEKYGNTTAATIPICLSEWYQNGKINKGDNLILSSFGAGFTWGAVYLKWNMND
ncbi:MAG: 3-oxoacyl-ACP synthase [Ignavibacteriae bacterium HGW-Ignavibacteriae-1]|jgi:3-oxoacyl-[acyl-carrier-protein] synthase-3|nr:MAG: 3-oxoacyl-ACP synthase [Ignavibacteriae bacterium HGW-Ignavibacteriae-1]